MLAPAAPQPGGLWCASGCFPGLQDVLRQPVTQLMSAGRLAPASSRFSLGCPMLPSRFCWSLHWSRAIIQRPEKTLTEHRSSSSSLAAADELLSNPHRAIPESPQQKPHAWEVRRHHDLPGHSTQSPSQLARPDGPRVAGGRGDGEVTGEMPPGEEELHTAGGEIRLLHKAALKSGPHG